VPFSLLWKGLWKSIDKDDAIQESLGGATSSYSQNLSALAFSRARAAWIKGLRFNLASFGEKIVTSFTLPCKRLDNRSFCDTRMLFPTYQTGKGFRKVR
jgi:hypothetical protein